MRKTLLTLLTVAALFGNPSIANCEKDTTSHQVTMTIPAYRVLYVNENDDITGIGILSDGIDFPEQNIKVFKNGSEMFLDDNIKSQYYNYLHNPELAQIDWSGKPGWRYYPINPQNLKDFETKLQASVLDGTFKSKSNESLEDGVLYHTITTEE